MASRSVTWHSLTYPRYYSLVSAFALYLSPASMNCLCSHNLISPFQHLISCFSSIQCPPLSLTPLCGTKTNIFLILDWLYIFFRGLFSHWPFFISLTLSAFCFHCHILFLKFHFPTKNLNYFSLK